MITMINPEAKKELKDRVIDELKGFPGEWWENLTDAQRVAINDTIEQIIADILRGVIEKDKSRFDWALVNVDTLRGEVLAGVIGASENIAMALLRGLIKTAADKAMSIDMGGLFDWMSIKVTGDADATT